MYNNRPTSFVPRSQQDSTVPSSFTRRPQIPASSISEESESISFGSGLLRSSSSSSIESAALDSSYLVRRAPPEPPTPEPGLPEVYHSHKEAPPAKYSHGQLRELLGTPISAGLYTPRVTTNSRSPRAAVYWPSASWSLFSFSPVLLALLTTDPLAPFPCLTRPKAITNFNPDEGATLFHASPREVAGSASQSYTRLTSTDPPSSSSGRPILSIRKRKLLFNQSLQTVGRQDQLEAQIDGDWPRLARSPFAASPQVSRGSLKLHWQLLPYDPIRSNKFIHFDVAFPTSDIEYRQNSPYGVKSTPLSDADFEKLATDRKSMKIIIMFQRGPFKWHIQVERDEGIRVRDVFEAIYDFFQIPLSSYEKSLIPRHHLAGYEKAFRLRHTLAAHPTVGQSHDWKRIDTLLHETLFCGMTRSNLGNWRLDVSGSMPTVNQGSNSKDGMGVLSDALIYNPETTASMILNNSRTEHEYLPLYPIQTPEAPPKYSDIDLFNIPLSAAFVSPSNGVGSDKMLPSWNACRICNFTRLNAFLQHRTLYTLLNNVPLHSPDPSSQDNTWAFFCRFVPLGALFDSPARGPLPMTHPGSGRTRLIETLELALDNPKNSMSWLHGPLGTGKSVIAYNLASRCRQKHRLAGSFFFSHVHANCRSAHSVVLALAYQLGLSEPLAKDKIITALSSDPGLMFPSRDLREKFARLIIEPLETVDWRLLSRAFIIDALDQCQDQVPDLISLLTRLLSRLTDAGIHIFFTSCDKLFIKRHFVPLTSVFIERHSAVVKSDIGLGRIDIDLDIRLFLHQSFQKICTRHRLQTRKPWPPDGVIDHLADRVGPNFDAASVVVRFVESPDHDPTDRMDLISHILTNPSSPSESSVDDFYKSIISTSDDIEQTYLHLTIVASLASMLSCSQLDNLLNRRNHKFDMCLVLSQLPTLIHIPSGYDGAVQVCHESLCDFLSDPLRCGEQFISQAMVHRLLAYSSLSVMVEELPDDSTISSHLTQLMTDSTSLGGFDNESVLSLVVYLPPDPLQLLSTFRHIMQHDVVGLTADPRTYLALGYFFCTWQIFQHLDLSTFATLPAFRFLEDIRSLPVFLAFPIFLSFESPKNDRTPGPLTVQHEPRIEALDVAAGTVNHVYAFKDRYKTGSGALNYACIHWAHHLSLAEWDDDLRSILMVFMKQKLRQWLVKAWCFQGFETCLEKLSEVQKLCLTANPPVHFGTDTQCMDVGMAERQKAV